MALAKSVKSAGAVLTADLIWVACSAHIKFELKDRMDKAISVKRHFDLLFDILNVFLIVVS
ncbi:hypothetical protein PN36_30885 [Candidatus Thiomargarita nelsonii]|uniref:Uncharacterized protein n=1 Tax=Candidatus Thiomargarita nelsonii TaxID=1003181 RepID=A0A0A6PH67_9GAMM|nr:hypothetical protein PN36_30885 [Candidatus Thiomargarita nelsonii]